MRGARASARTARLLLILSLLVVFLLPASPQANDPSNDAVVGRLLSPDSARVVVRRAPCYCQPLREGDADVLLLLLGTESELDADTHFHPLATLAFDRTLGEEDPGQWMGMWVFGPSAPGWRRTFRAFLPLPVGAPTASTRTLEKLDQQLEEIQQGGDQADLLVPDPVVHLANLGRYPRSQSLWAGIQRGLKWANVFNPAQLIYRSYLVRRMDRNERQFQRAYVALQWLLDQEFDGTQEMAWLATLNDLRFHLLRNRSFAGGWLEHADGLELVYNYESSSRAQLGKSSSWLQSAANEHLLGYQPIYRYTTNGTGYPIGGVLYYDPKLAAQPDPGWWSIANPFDLPYNPHTHPGVQRLAREHPDELIPLSVYIFQTHLALRPIVAVDFFAPGNPRHRERMQQLMILAKQWLIITTGALAPARLPYRLTAWAANKKGFTWLVDKSSRKGIEELRLALEAELYFDPPARRLLLERADQRVLNPLVKAGPVEERLAHIQYLSLRANENHALCEQVKQVRERMLERLRVPKDLAPEAQRRELAQRLRTWHQQVRLADFVAEPLGEFGSLGSLEEPLSYFLEAEPLDTKEFEKLLARLYAKLYRQELRLPASRSVPELTATLELTRQVWQRTAADSEAYERQRAKLEREARERHQHYLVEVEKKHRQLLREFLKESQKELERARRAGCDRDAAFPGSLEAHLAVLRDVLNVANSQEHLRAELNRQAPRLRRDLQRLEVALNQCPADGAQPWLAESHQFSRELARNLQEELSLEARANRVRGD